MPLYAYPLITLAVVAIILAYIWLAQRRWGVTPTATITEQVAAISAGIEIATEHTHLGCMEAMIEMLPKCYRAELLAELKEKREALNAAKIKQGRRAAV